MKGYEGWIWIGPEDEGWGPTTPTLVKGNFIYADSESLAINKEFVDRPEKITFGRALKGNSRANRGQKPGGEITFQPRAEDLPPVMMAHFQKYIGVAAGGSTTFTFVPCSGSPNWSGSSFGSGGYVSPDGDIFTIAAIKKFTNTSDYDGTNAMWFKSCIVDSLKWELNAGEDVKLTADLKAYTVDAGTAIGSTLDPNSALGSYSTRTPFEFYQATLTVAGTNFDITKWSWSSMNNAEDLAVLGSLNPSKYPLGRYGCEGDFSIYAPKDVLRYVGSMLADREFAITATLANGTGNTVTISKPRCKYKAFDVNIASGDADTVFDFGYVAYASEDGATPPVTVTVIAQGYGSTPSVRV